MFQVYFADKIQMPVELPVESYLDHSISFKFYSRQKFQNDKQIRVHNARKSQLTGSIREATS